MHNNSHHFLPHEQEAEMVADYIHNLSNNFSVGSMEIDIHGNLDVAYSKLWCYSFNRTI